MNQLTYKVYRAELDESHQLIKQADGSVWLLVAQIGDAKLSAETAAYRDSATVSWIDRFAEFTDPNLAYGKRYMWRVTVQDELGNESLAAAQAGVRIRRHLGRAELAGKIMIGWQPEGGVTTNWAYVLDPLADNGLAEYSTRWMPFDEAVENIPGLEKLYELLVIDNRPPTAPVAATIAHGGDGSIHEGQHPAAPIRSGSNVLDTYAFGSDWQSWKSNFGQNLSDAFYSRQNKAFWQGKITPRWSATLAVGDNTKLVSGKSALFIEIGQVRQELVVGVDFPIGATAAATLASIRTLIQNGPLPSVCTVTDNTTSLTLVALDAGLQPKRVAAYLLDDNGTPRMEQPWRCAMIFADPADATKQLTLTVDGTSATFTAGTDYQNGASPDEAAANFLTAVMASSLSSKLSGFRQGSIVYLNASSMTFTGQVQVVALSSGSVTPWAAELEQGFSVTHASPFPVAGDEIWAFGKRLLRFASTGYGPGTGVVRVFSSTPDDTSWVMMDAQLAAIAEGITTTAGVRPLKAWIEPGSHSILVESTGVLALDPHLEYRPAGSTIALGVSTPVPFSWRKATEDGSTDTDLTASGEGSGQGFWADMTSQPSGHLHLMVNWQDAASERGSRFSRGVILVDGRFFAEYIPGTSDGIVEYLVTTDRKSGRILSADGVTPTVVEIRKYHPSGTWSSQKLVKVCPKRTQVRRDTGLRLLTNDELNLVFDPWNAKLRADLTLLPEWTAPAPAFRPRFIETQLYVSRSEFLNQLTAAALPAANYSDLRSPAPTLPNACLYDQANLPDLFSSAEPPAGKQALTASYSWTRDLTQTGADECVAGKLYLRARMFDGWGLTTAGLLTTDLSIAGNTGLWSLPDQVPSVESFSWVVEASGTETYRDAVDPDGPDPDEPDTKTLLTRAWLANSQGDMSGWRKRSLDESQHCPIVVGDLTQHKTLGATPRFDLRRVRALRRRPSMATVSVRVQSLSCRDWGDDPLLADGQAPENDSARHEVATFLPRAVYQSVPFRQEQQLLLTDANTVPTGAVTVNLEAGSWDVRYGWGSIYAPSSQSQPYAVNLMVCGPDGLSRALMKYEFASIEELRNARNSGVLSTARRLDVPAPGAYQFWCVPLVSGASTNLSFNLLSQGQRLQPVERPALPYVINDFVNWDDADAPQGRRSGAPREWADLSEALNGQGRVQWHDGDYADTVPAGQYPLSITYTAPAKDAYEMDLVAHALRSDLGVRIQIAGVTGLLQGELTQVYPITVLLPALLPLSPLDFSKAKSGWGLGDSRVEDKTISGITDARIASGGNCRGLITRSSAKVLGPVWTLKGATPFGRLAVGTTSSSFKVHWQKQDGSWLELPQFTLVDLPDSAYKGFLWVNDQALPTDAPLRLAVSFPQSTAANPQSLLGVWATDEVAAWKVWVNKDGAPWSGATGSTSPVAVTALPAGSPLKLDSLHSLTFFGTQSGRYTIHLRAEVANASAAQTAGNTLLGELPNLGESSETTQGIEVRVQVKVN